MYKSSQTCQYYSVNRDGRFPMWLSIVSVMAFGLYAYFSGDKNDRR